MSDVVAIVVFLWLAVVFLFTSSGLIDAEEGRVAVTTS
jgi:hypothetical protein